MEDQNLKSHYTAVIPVQNVVSVELNAKYTTEPDSPTVAKYFIKKNIKLELTLHREKNRTILALVPDIKYHK